MLDLANTYLGMWSKLEYVDLWYTPPTEEVDRQSSQRWHRDFNDRLLLKAFLYLSDVDESAGPFEYVPRSFPGGELGDLWPWYPGYDGYPPDEEFARRMEGKRIETFTGAARHAHLLQHLRLPPRWLRDRQGRACSPPGRTRRRRR